MLLANLFRGGANSKTTAAQTPRAADDSSNAIVAKCREIYQGSLPSEQYAAGQKDYDKSWQGRLNWIMRSIEPGRTKYARDLLATEESG